jgi:hypothetical protein
MVKALAAVARVVSGVKVKWSSHIIYQLERLAKKIY